MIQTRVRSMWSVAGVTLIGFLTVAVCVLPVWGQGFSAARQDFLAAIKSGDVDLVLEGLEKVVRFETPEAVKLVLRFGIVHDDLIVHEECFDYLQRLKDNDARRVVLDSARKDKSWERRAQCARAIATYHGHHTREVLEEIVTGDKNWHVRAAGTRAMAHQRHKQFVKFLVERLKLESTRRVRWDVVEALRSITGFDFQDDYVQWAQWWGMNEEEFHVPTKAELAKMRGKDLGPQDLKTAVAEGLYGPIYSEKVIFVFDVSGSMSVGTEMQGSRLDIAKRELIKAVANLSQKGYFNIVAFSDEIYMFRPHMLKSKEKSLRKGIKWIEKLGSGGETNAYGALKAAFDDKEMDTIFFLSDGSPTVAGDDDNANMDNPVNIRQAIAGWNRNRMAIVNCIGFFPGEAQNEDKKDARDFLLKLAHENDGFYKEIY